MPAGWLHPKVLMNLRPEEHSNSIHLIPLNSKVTNVSTPIAENWFEFFDFIGFWILVRENAAGGKNLNGL